MTTPPRRESAYVVTCPHCKKRFQAHLLSGSAQRYQGFKCPHCRLFVSYSRAEEQDRVKPQA